VYTLWLLVQITVIALLTVLDVNRIEGAIPGGFQYRASILGWLYANETLPRGLATQPTTSLLEAAGVILGSLLTGGVLGNWFLARAANLAGFMAGSLWLATGTMAALPLAIPIWTIIRIAAFAGMVIILSEPLLTSNWSIRYYLTARKSFAIVVVVLLVVSALAEIILPPTWRFLMRQLSLV
jgi:hypothetical protein